MIQTRGEKAFRAGNSIFLVILGLVMVFPFYTILVQSLSPAVDFIKKDIIVFPSKLELEYFKIIFSGDSRLIDAYKITVFVTVVGTFYSMALTLLGGYALAEKKLPFRTPITFVFLFTMYFGGGLIPSYLLIRHLHLIDQVWALIIPGGLSVFNMLLMRNFIMQLPGELLESAIIDGCSQLRMLVSIVIPLSTAAMATLSLMYAVGYWNTFSSAVYYINTPKKQPLQVFLYNILYDVSMSENMKEAAKAMSDGYTPPVEGVRAATIVAATVPILCVYPFLQRYFVKGVTMGALKG